MVGYGSTIILLVGIHFGSLDPRPLDELTINLNLGDASQVNTPMDDEAFDEDQELKAGHTDMVPVVIGGVNRDGNVLSGAMYNRLGPWATMGAFNPPRWSLAAENLDGQLYMVGGKEDLNPNTLAVNNVEKLTLENGSYLWVHDSYLISGRAFFTLTAVQNAHGQKTLMVTGGITRDSTSFLQTTEIYFNSSKFWNHGPEMHVKRFGHAAAFFLGNLYVFGGHYVRANESTEFLEFHTGTWSFGPRPRVSRKFHAAAVLGNYIYMCGGSPSFFDAILASCERFNGNTWMPIGDMKEPGIKFGMVTIGAQIWAIGGMGKPHGTRPGMLDSVEKYDKEIDIWIKEPNFNLPAPRMLFGVGTFSIDI